VGTGSSLGLIEIDGEATTGDGEAPASKSQDPKDILHAVVTWKKPTKVVF
jgi:hypothetical protein